MNENKIDGTRYNIPPDYDQGSEYERVLNEFYKQEDKEVPFLINQYLKIGGFGQKYFPELFPLLDQFPIPEEDIPAQFYIAGLIRKLPFSIDQAIREVKDCSIPDLQLNLLVPLISVCKILKSYYATLGSPIIDISLDNINNMVVQGYDQCMVLFRKVYKQCGPFDDNGNINKTPQGKKGRSIPTFKGLFSAGYDTDEKIAELKKAFATNKLTANLNIWVGTNNGPRNELSTICHYLQSKGVFKVPMDSTGLKVFYGEFGLKITTGDRKEAGDYANVKSISKDKIDATTEKLAKEILKDYLRKE